MKLDIRIHNENVNDYVRDIFPGVNISDLTLSQKKQLIKNDLKAHIDLRVRQGMTRKITNDAQISNEALIITQLNKNSAEEVAE